MLKTVKNLLKTYGVSPSKHLGQNFLIDKNIIKKIVKTAKPLKNDVILEIGPGIGNLTQELAKKAKKVIAVEKDPKMCIILNNLNLKNVNIIEKDILKLDLKKELPSNYKVVANIPYYLTSKLIRKLLESENRPSQITLMIQKEVAERICNIKEKKNLLAISVWFYAKPEIKFSVSKNSFYPTPKVDSSVIQIKPYNKTPSKEFSKKFFYIVKAGFSHPRKQLINNFSQKLEKNKNKTSEWLRKNNISPQKRAEDLTLENWKKLTQTLDLLT
jgi:16S rRNA (adenine1518-N6/adenine1519-N6)-dimethyltransferase